MNDNPNNKLLSICIPTYNRGHTLDKLLESIEEEINSSKCNNVEIIISDNASTDNTEEIVNKYIKKNLSILYYRMNENMGFGVNINNSIKIASGDYCWFIGADDTIEKNSLNLIFDAIKQNPSAIIGSAIINKQEKRLIVNSKDSFVINNEITLSEFIDSCTELSALFAFISTIIVKRDFWNLYQSEANIIDHPYTHQIRLLSLIKNNCAIVKNISGVITKAGKEKNEWSSTIVSHFILDCKTLKYICEEIFSDSSLLKKSISNLIRRKHSSLRLKLMRGACSSKEWGLLSQDLDYFDFPRNLLNRKTSDVLFYKLYLGLKFIKYKVSL